MYRHLSKNLKLCGDVIGTIGSELSVIAGVFLLFAGMFQEHSIYENTIFTQIPAYALILGGIGIALIGMGIFYSIGLCVSSLGELIERTKEHCTDAELD
ncbi:MAG: hypothetical protein ACI4HZ_00755 [Ruminococcus sp.]